MQKFSLLLIALCTSSWSMPTVDLSSHHYKCGGIVITKKSTVEQLTQNCKNAQLTEREDTASGRNSDDVPGGGADITEDYDQSNEIFLDKVKFLSDAGNYMICYFKNDVLSKCQANPPKSIALPTLASAPIAIGKNQPMTVESK